MSSRLNEMENEGLIVIGRPLSNEWEDCEKVKAVAAAVDAWASKLSLPLGLIYCGTTINWPEEVKYTPLIIGLVTFSGYGDDDEPVAGVVPPSAMSASEASKIPAEFWADLEATHGVAFSDEPDVYLACAGWTWARMEGGGHKVSTSTEDSGFRIVPEAARGTALTMKVGYC